MVKIKQLDHDPIQLLLLVVVMPIIAAVVLGGIQAGSNKNPNADSGCGDRVSNYNYQVPFGNAAWNVPVCDLDVHPDSDDYAYRFFNYAQPNDGSAEAMANRGKVKISFGLGDRSKTFARAVYDAKDATTTRLVQVCPNGCSPSNLDGADVTIYDQNAFLPNTRVPWNPSWTTATAGDNELLILDHENGRLWSFSGLRTDQFGAIAYCGPLFRERLCATSANILRDRDGEIADFRTYEGSDYRRGVGFSYYATLTTPQEVAAGEIRHALGVGMFGTAIGPECTTAQLGTPAEMNTCGVAVAPAGKFEFADSLKVSDRWGSHQEYDSIYTQDKLIPEGMRFALELSDQDIDSWIQSREDLRTNQTKASTARIFANALRDYGFFVVDTGGFSSIQTSSGMNVENKQRWNQLGITDESDNNLLDGLFTEDNIYTIDMPTNHCVDSTKSQYHCEYTTSRYDIDDSNPDPDKLPGDTNNDNKVDVADLSTLLTTWDPNGSQGDFRADFNNDNLVDVVDLSILLSSWTG